MYKSGDFLTVHTLIEKGFYFYCWFAGYHVYKTLDDDKAIYISNGFFGNVRKDGIRGRGC